MDGKADVFASVDALSSSSSHGGSKPAASCRGRAQQRKRRASFSESVSDASALRAMLGKPKCHCKRTCLAQFSDDALFSKLLSFRSDWASLHKLDQDTEVAWQTISCFLTFSKEIPGVVKYEYERIKVRFSQAKAPDSI